MPAYIKLEDVKLRLAGKVRFVATDDGSGKMTDALAKRLIDEAEGQVEQDLSPRYAAPFISTSDGTYASIPDRPTKNIIRTLCELQACIRILETDFGSGTAIDGSKYTSMLEKRYRKIIDDSILAKPSQEYAASRQWAFPPLPNLKKANFNTEADDGYAGLGPIVTTDEIGGYPVTRINDPSQDFINGTLDDKDRS